MIELVTRAEAARALGVCERTIKRWEERGALRPAVNTGERGTVRFRRSDLEKVRAQHQKWQHWNMPSLAG